MSKKTLIAISTLLFTGAILAAAGSLCLAGDSGPETIELKTSAGKKPAKFPHKKHQESFECRECHHTKTAGGMKSSYEEGMEIKKCITCHNKDDMDNPKISSLKLAAHGLCKECHKQNKDSAPTKCSGCHIK